ncbi:redoxin family protein [Flavitalea flava]
MKKKIVYCIIATGSLFACKSGQDKDAGMVVKGTLTGIDSGIVKLMLYNEDDRTSKTIDSVVILNHSFEIKRKIGTPVMMSLMVQPGNWGISLFAEDTTITITADTTGAEYYDYTAYGGQKGANIKKSTETGSRNFDDFMKYQTDPTLLKHYEPVFAELNKKLTAAANVDSQYKIRDQMDSVKKVLQAKQKAWIDDYVMKNPSSVAGAYIFGQFYMFSQDMPAAELETMLNKFQGQARSSAYYQTMAAALDKKKTVLPGSVAPDFTLLKRDSSQFTLSSSRGNYLMIDFWASWCHPCRQAIPHWKGVYQKYHDKGFNMISVSDDSRWPDWIKAMDAEKMPWTQVCDEFPVKNMPAKVGSLYMTTYIPFYVLLDKEGKILVYSGKEEDIDNKLKEIFGS